jgi:hypothetical protein
MVDMLPPNMQLVPGSLTLTGDGSVYTTTTLAEVASLGVDTSGIAAGSTMIVWTGTLGGNRIDVPDARIQYAALPSGTGCFVNATTLVVQQEMITDTFRNEGQPFLWPKHPVYTTSVTGCPMTVYLPFIGRQ